jgi:N6-L-threonylcarbamoyladenine synthase
MALSQRRQLGHATMRLAFEHLATRVVFALHELLGSQEAIGTVDTLVVSGGVASNRFLMHVLRSFLAARGLGHVKVIAPPPSLCTDNAAMIAWTGVEMWQAGWRSDMHVIPIRKWSVDPASEDGGILGVNGWFRDKGEATTVRGEEIYCPI